jgi:hypothetical protein
MIYTIYKRIHIMLKIKCNAGWRRRSVLLLEFIDEFNFFKVDQHATSFYRLHEVLNCLTNRKLCPSLS